MNIRPEIAKISKEAIAWRREMHANPGIAYDERVAYELIGTKLTQWGIEYEAGWGKNPSWDPKYKGTGGYGIVATIHGNQGSGDTIGLRADMDALPIQEATNLNWSSQNPGLMHACGHDGHTAILLTAARHFSLNPNFKGTLKLIFQPAEEGAKGAKAMLQEGLLTRHPMSRIFALHNAPHLPLGTIAVPEKEAMASSSYFNIQVRGKSAHAAVPEEAVDATFITAMMRVCLPESVLKGPISNRVAISYGKMISGLGGADSIIPADGQLSGTIRTYNPELARSVFEEIKRMAERIAQHQGGSATVTFREGSPATINTPAEAAMVAEIARGVVGSDNVILNPPPPLFAEDFGFMLQERPGCYFMLGQGNPNDPSSPYNQPLHNPGYDFNDDAIPAGAETMVRIVEHCLS